MVKKSFLKGFSAKVLDRDPKRLPALHVGSRIPWVGMHEHGGQIGGRMLIPLHGRVGRKTFKRQVDALMRGGNAYFVKNAKGHVVLMAENIAEHDRPLAGFKRRYRKAEGIKRLKRGADIPIAVLVPEGGAEEAAGRRAAGGGADSAAGGGHRDANCPSVMDAGLPRLDSRARQATDYGSKKVGCCRPIAASEPVDQGGRPVTGSQS